LTSTQGGERESSLKSGYYWQKLPIYTKQQMNGGYGIPIFLVWLWSALRCQVHASLPGKTVLKSGAGGWRLLDSLFHSYS